MQALAWSITLWLVAVLAAAFILVAVRGSQKGDGAAVAAGGARIRAIMFWVLLVAGVPITMVTLADLPYNAQAKGGDVQIVTAEGSQFAWELSTDTLTTGTVEFQVTSTDATHGFAIYNSELVLLAQVQAMPEYTNVLRYTFTEPGAYKVMCLEYCGMGHPIMTADFTVTGGN